MRQIAQFLALAGRVAQNLRGATNTTAFVLLALISLVGQGVAQAPTVNTSSNYPAFGHVYQFNLELLHSRTNIVRIESK